MKKLSELCNLTHKKANMNILTHFNALSVPIEINKNKQQE